jgi:hypothetical protein
VLLAGSALHLMIIWCRLVAASAAAGILFCDDNGLWPSVQFLVGNATLVACDPPPKGHSVSQTAHLVVFGVF